MAATYRIGELARELQLPVETIRYYERERLLPPPARSSGNYREYSEAHREQLSFIRHCRLLDMTLEEVRELLRLRAAPRASCADVNSLLDSHIAHVSERMKELGRLRRQLQTLRRLCNPTGAGEDCGILNTLSKGFGAKSQRGRSHVLGTHKRRAAGPADD